MIKDEVKEDIRYEIKENTKEEIKENTKEEIKEDKKEDKDTKRDPIDWIKDTKKEDKDTKWEPIDWTKDMKEKDKDTKWEPIDWTKDTKKEEKDTQWEPIDWTKDTTETKKIEGYKNTNLDDIKMEIDDNNIDFVENVEVESDEQDFIERIVEDLEGKDKDGKSGKDVYNMMERSGKIKNAEIIGILLGDGYLRHNKNEYRYGFTITLNRVDEEKYVDYVSELIKSIYGKEPSRIVDENSKEITLSIHGREIVESLISKGMVPGDKKEHQVKVPSWIMKDQDWIDSNYEQWELKQKPLVISCLKGLFDTDGSIFPVIKENALKMNFTSASRPLAKNFKDMCKALQIRTSKISKYQDISDDGKILTRFRVQIQARDQVKKFVEIVKPMKWKHKKENLLDIIDKPFEYRIFRYSKLRAEYLKELYEKIGNYRELRTYLRDIVSPVPYIETITNHVKKLFKEDNYLKKFGKAGYKEWYKNNSRINIDRFNGNIKHFNSNVRKIICRQIYEILDKKTSNINNYLIHRILNDKFQKSEFRRLNYLLNNSEYKNPTKDYINNLIRLVSYLKLNPVDRMSSNKVRQKLNLKMNHIQIKKIIDDLKSHFPENF